VCSSLRVPFPLFPIFKLQCIESPVYSPSLAGASDTTQARTRSYITPAVESNYWFALTAAASLILAFLTFSCSLASST
jgi:hypothetical protein